MNCYFIFIYCTHCWTVSKKVNHMLTTLYSFIKFLESLSIQLYSVILLVSSVPHTIMTLGYHKFTTALREMHFFVLAKNPKMKSMFMIYSQFNCRYVFLNNIETFYKLNHLICQCPKIPSQIFWWSSYAKRCCIFIIMV